jgi:hypothetical protein
MEERRARQTDTSEYFVAPAIESGAEPAEAGWTRLALFVTHGMGQQVPFATVSDLATELRRDPAFARTEPRAEMVLLGDQRLQRIVLRLEAERREVHLYEGYWAPLTEGAVTLRDVLRFLVQAGRNGLHNGEGVFRRWAFGKLQEYPIPVRTWIYLVIAVLGVTALVSMNAVIALVSAARATLGAGPTWLSDALFEELTTTLNLFLLVAVGFGFVLALARRLRRHRAPMWLRRIVAGLSVAMLLLALVAVVVAGIALPALVLIYARRPAGSVPVTRGMFWDTILRHAGTQAVNDTSALLLLLALLGIVLWLGVRPVAVLVWRALKEQLDSFGRLAQQRQQPRASLLVLAALVLLGVTITLELLAFVRYSGESIRMPARLLLTWPALVLVSAAVRFFLIQYVGDVAVYVASHTVDRFSDLRQRIKDWVYARARAVYAAEGAERYDGVVVVGHSLGSVVSYDVLNRLLNEDQLQRTAGGAVLDVASRTRLFLTFGSPLDKTAFIFAIQNRRMNEAREALATTLQPLIRDYAVRSSLRWINIYSPWDIISGALNYYDEPSMNDPRAVRNLADPDATTVLAAHAEYWTAPLLRTTLAEALLA